MCIGKSLCNRKCIKFFIALTPIKKTGFYSQNLAKP